MVHCQWHLRTIWGFPKFRGTLFGGPHNNNNSKDHSILGSILGFPILGNYNIGFRTQGQPYLGHVPVDLKTCLPVRSADRIPPVSEQAVEAARICTTQA